MENKEHEFCLRCGRKLKNPKTRILGLGPVCHRKSLQEYEQSRKLFDVEKESQEQKKQ